MDTIECLLMMMCSRSLSVYVGTFGIFVAAATTHTRMHTETLVGLGRIYYGKEIILQIIQCGISEFVRG